MKRMTAVVLAIIAAIILQGSDMMVLAQETHAPTTTNADRGYLSCVEQERANDTYISAEYVAYIEEIAEKYNICPEFIMAMIEKESSGNPNAVNKAGTCHGLMQINPKWHWDRMERLGVTDLYDPYSNILVGTDYVRELFDRYECPAMVLMKYNGTKNATERWENGNYTNYALGIMERSEQLERLHGK